MEAGTSSEAAAAASVTELNGSGDLEEEKSPRTPKQVSHREKQCPVCGKRFSRLYGHLFRRRESNSQVILVTATLFADMPKHTTTIDLLPRRERRLVSPAEGTSMERLPVGCDKELKLLALG